MLHPFFLLLLLLAGLPAAADAEGAPPSFVEEVPYVQTPDRVTEAMLDLGGVKAGDHLIDLGSGDGRIVIAAAHRGATALGVEIDPRLVAESIAKARHAGVAERTTFLEQDLFKTDLAPATVITLYLLPQMNLQLRPALLALRPGTRIVSHDWDMGEWKPERTVVVEVPEKLVGLQKHSYVHLWIVPARVDGQWCGARGPKRAILRLAQQFQQLSGAVQVEGQAPVAVTGRAEGKSLVLARDAKRPEAALRLVAADDGLAPVEATGAFAAIAGMRWRRARSDVGCDAP